MKQSTTSITTRLSRHLARSAVKRQTNMAAHKNTRYEFIYLQTWLIIATIVAFAAYVAHDQSLFSIMVETDKSYLSLLIIVVFLAATCHAAWNIYAMSARARAAGRMLDGDIDARFTPDRLKPSVRATARLNDKPEQFIGNFMRDTKESQLGSSDTDTHMLEIYADQLRSPVEIGWYIVDVLIRLGLIGTIVGFILILRSLVGAPLPSADQIQSLLITMSGGMGTALFTTLAGLSTATILGLQYMILGRSVETLIAALIRLDAQTKINGKD